MTLKKVSVFTEILELRLMSRVVLSVFASMWIWLCLLNGAVAADTKIRLTDDSGVVIELEQPAKRVVALAPNIVENLWAIGAGGYIVGTVEHSDFPVEAKRITRVGNYASASIEAILALQPDLVLAWQAGISMSTVNKLRALGLTVYVDALPTVQDIANTLRVYGTLLGVSERANQQAEQFERDMLDLEKFYEDAERVPVFYQVWHDPIQTLNNNSLIGEIIGLCGGKNVFGDALSVAPIVSVEGVIAADPDIIVASGRGDERPEWLDKWLKFPEISAVKQSALVHIHPDILQRHTLRVLQGAKEMCLAIDQVRQGQPSSPTVLK